MELKRIYTEADLLDCPNWVRHWFTDMGDRSPNCIHCGAPHKAVRAAQVQRNRQIAKAHKQRMRAAAMMEAR
jgi:hypothetical protein